MGSRQDLLFPSVRRSDLRTIARDVTEIESDSFQTPSCCPGSMGKVVAKVVERSVVNVFSLCFGCQCFEFAEPVMDTCLS